MRISSFLSFSSPFPHLRSSVFICGSKSLCEILLRALALKCSMRPESFGELEVMLNGRSQQCSSNAWRDRS
jgi:hypothetical protein